MAHWDHLYSRSPIDIIIHIKCSSLINNVHTFNIIVRGARAPLVPLYPLLMYMIYIYIYCKYGSQNN